MRESPGTRDVLERILARVTSIEEELQQFRTEVTGEFGTLRIEVRQGLDALRMESSQDLVAACTDLQRDLATVRAESQQGLGGIRGEIQQLSARLDTRIGTAARWLAGLILLSWLSLMASIWLRP